jgi:hypothetical protein
VDVFVSDELAERELDRTIGDVRRAAQSNEASAHAPVGEQVPAELVSWKGFGVAEQKKLEHGYGTSSSLQM